MSASEAQPSPRWRAPLVVTGTLLAIGAGLLTLQWSLAPEVADSRLAFDRANLTQLFPADLFDNDPATLSVLIEADVVHPRLVNQHLLGLRRDRLAYIATQGDEVVGVAIPATADDGFNGYVDILVSLDMFGRVIAARVIEDLAADQAPGSLAVIESRWMEGFSGLAMRDIRRTSWGTIAPDREYDQFVGASITPKAVADQIYNALVFFQSNRIAFLEEARHDLP